MNTTAAACTSRSASRASTMRRSSPPSTDLSVRAISIPPTSRSAARPAGDPPAGRKVNVLSSVPTNFKVAKFDNDKGNKIIRQLEQEIDAIRHDPGDGRRSSCR